MPVKEVDFTTKNFKVSKDNKDVLELKRKIYMYAELISQFNLP